MRELKERVVTRTLPARVYFAVTTFEFILWTPETLYKASVLPILA
jgi:hypothetical protein